MLAGRTHAGQFSRGSDPLQFGRAADADLKAKVKRASSDGAFVNFAREYSFAQSYPKNTMMSADHHKKNKKKEVEVGHLVRTFHLPHSA